MLKLVSISFSFLIFMQSLGICFTDLVKLNQLIEHASFHSEQYGDDVFTFVAKHYGESKAEHQKEHQEEKEDHEKLPFQNHSHISTVSAMVSPVYKADFNKIEFVQHTISNFHYQEPSSALHSLGLFQPPRIS
ncbi:hypothetical protein M666_14130 [Cellulophaga baltica 18]|uniref:Uncharacterized protein n=2 Tax=Cellulophaga baltica TaxID=76594 RepID=A0AAU8RV48_9FLAO|nr:hypothetical protein M666_14130 [Cellulophaga baltica 18]